jgi:hypothetical protein
MILGELKMSVFEHINLFAKGDVFDWTGVECKDEEWPLNDVQTPWMRPAIVSQSNGVAAVAHSQEIFFLNGKDDVIRPATGHLVDDFLVEDRGIQVEVDSVPTYVRTVHIASIDKASNVQFGYIDAVAQGQRWIFGLFTKTG